jgi:hypothetical protein
MKVGRLKPRAFTSYFLTSGHRRGLVVLIRKSNNLASETDTGLNSAFHLSPFTNYALRLTEFDLALRIQQ